MVGGESEQVLSRDEHPQRGDECLPGEGCGQSVAELDVLEAGISAVIDHEVGRYPVHAVSDYETREPVGGAVSGPASEHVGGEVGVGDVGAAGGIVYVVADGALQEHGEVETSPRGVEVETPGPVRSALADEGAVGVGDDAVLIDVDEADVSGECVGLDHPALGVGVGTDLLDVLEDSVGLVAVEVGERHSVLGARDGAGALEGVEVGPSGFVAVFDELVAEVRQVAGNAEVEVLLAVFVGALQFDAAVLHDTHVAGRLGFTYVRRDVHGHQHAVGDLLEPVDGEGYGVVEESEVETEVGLDGLFPTQALVGESAGLYALDGLFGVAEDVVVAAAGENGVTEVTDVLVTVLAPGEAGLCHGHPGRKVDVGLAVDVPSEGERRECSPVVVGAEAGRTVTADREFGHVALGVVVAGAEEV